MLADGEVRFFMQIDLDHEFVKPQLVVFGALFFEKFGRDFLGNDLGPDVIGFGQAKPHLLQDEVHLFILLHGPVRFHLKGAEKMQRSMLPETSPHSSTHKKGKNRGMKAKKFLTFFNFFYGLIFLLKNF